VRASRRPYDERLTRTVRRVRRRLAGEFKIAWGPLWLRSFVYTTALLVVRAPLAVLTSSSS
jgi:hypothetical protein